MTKLGVWLVEGINWLFPSVPNLEEMHCSKLSTEAYQQHEYEEIVKLYPEFGPCFDLQGKWVLDVGSGLGGKPTFYAEEGARHVIGIDLRSISCQATQVLAQKKELDNITPLVGDASIMPFADNSFDAIISVNVFEHVDNVRESLLETWRVLRPNGMLFLHFPPFYSPWGAHLENWINFPWPHVFFSDKTLIQVAGRIDKRRRNNANYIPTAQVDWDSLSRLPELNRVTAAQFFDLLKETDFEILKSEMLPFGRHFLPRYKPFGKILLDILKFFGNLPLLREVITTKMVFVLCKKDRIQ